MQPKRELRTAISAAVRFRQLVNTLSRSLLVTVLSVLLQLAISGGAYALDCSTTGASESGTVIGTNGVGDKTDTVSVTNLTSGNIVALALTSNGSQSADMSLTNTGSGTLSASTFTIAATPATLAETYTATATGSHTITITITNTGNTANRNVAWTATCSVSRSLTINGGGAGTGTVAGTSPSTINCTSTAGVTSGTCSELISDGTVRALTATAAGGSAFTSWSGCDSASSNVCTQTVSGGNETVTANFGIAAPTVVSINPTSRHDAGRHERHDHRHEPHRRNGGDHRRHGGDDLHGR